MSDFMSLTAVTHADLATALANREAAVKRMNELVKEATPKYKEALNLKWWNFRRKKMTSAELLRADYLASYWFTREQLLSHVGLIPEDEIVRLDSHWNALCTVQTLVKSGKETAYVSEAVMHFINKWKTKEA